MLIATFANSSVIQVLPYTLYDFAEVLPRIGSGFDHARFMVVGELPIKYNGFKFLLA